MFLNLMQVNSLQTRLLSMTEKVAKAGSKLREKLFYALEPDRKIIHIINGEETIQTVIAILTEQGRKLLTLTNGKLFYEIPRSFVRFSKAIKPEEYTQVKNWGKGKNKTFSYRAFFGAGGLYFDLVDAENGEETQEIPFPDLPEGRLRAAETEDLGILFSHQSISGFIESLGLNFRPEIRSRIVDELKLVGEKLRAPQLEMSPALG